MTKIGTVAYDDVPKLRLVGRDLWEVAEDWKIEIDGKAILIPKGFLTDCASIPHFLRCVCGSPMELPRMPVAVIHDFAYEGLIAGMTRRQADSFYRYGLVCHGVPKWKANTEYVAIRAFGGRHWKGE